MKKIREKLRSQSGASILLALLFFLLCAMVGASVLMAAASNAGKSRSSREEQQKYLTLSSALQLVCDELESASYTAKYTYTYIEAETDSEGKITRKARCTYEQTEGKYEGGLSSANDPSKNVLPLRDELDWLFAQDFMGRISTDSVIYTYNERPYTKEPGTAHKLTLTVQGQTDKPGLTTPVTVTVTVGTGTAKYRLSLKATLGSEADSIYTMYAQLDMVGGAAAAPKPADHSRDDEYSCTPVKWKLSQITREEAK